MNKESIEEFRRVLYETGFIYEKKE